MRKLLIIILAGIAIIIASVLLYLRYRKSKDLEPVIKSRLSNLVRDASQGLYRLDIGNMEVDILQSRLVLVNAHLVPDTMIYNKLVGNQQAPNDLFDIYVDKIALHDINLTALAVNHDINLGKFFIDSPVVKVWHKKQSYNTSTDSIKPLYQRIYKDVSRVKVDTILLRDVNFTYINRENEIAGKKPLHFEKVNFIFTDMLIDSSTQYDQSRFLYAKDCRISLKDYELNTANGLSRLTADRLEIRTRDNVMELEKIRLKPLLSYTAIGNKIKRQQDIFTVNVSKLRLNNVAWWSLLGEESFVARKMELLDGSIEIYHDKSLPPGTDSKRGKFPHQLLSKVKFNILVDTVKLSDFLVSYEELNPNSGRTGKILFDKVNGSITNITNNEARIKNNNHTMVNATAMFLGEAPLKATFIFDLTNIQQGNFAVKASIGSLQQDRLNDILMPLALVKVNKVNLKSLDVDMHGDNYRGDGTVKLIYSDLNVTALKLKGDTLKARTFFSFIANNFVLKKDNPVYGQQVRVEHGERIHEPHRSFFNLVWKTIFSGAAKTIGYSPKEKS